MELKSTKKKTCFSSVHQVHQSMDFSFPIGELRTTITGEEVFSIQSKRQSKRVFQKTKSSFSQKDFYSKEGKKKIPPLLIEVVEQLQAYFEKKQKKFKFDLPLTKREEGDLDEKVRHILKDVPFGSVISYSELAVEVGHPRAYRAVGGSCSRNPFLIVVPCHRVINKNGDLGGFAIGLSSKKKLLKHEGSLPLLEGKKARRQEGKKARWNEDIMKI